MVRTLIALLLISGPALAQGTTPQPMQELESTLPAGNGSNPPNAHVDNAGPGYGQAPSIPTPTLDSRPNTPNGAASGGTPPGRR